MSLLGKHFWLQNLCFSLKFVLLSIVFVANLLVLSIGATPTNKEKVEEARENKQSQQQQQGWLN